MWRHAYVTHVSLIIHLSPTPPGSQGGQQTFFVKKLYYIHFLVSYSVFEVHIGALTKFKSRSTGPIQECRSNKIFSIPTARTQDL